MNFLLKSYFKPKRKILSKWSSKNFCRKQVLNMEKVEDIQIFIEHIDSFQVFDKCFLSNIFINEIASCFTQNKIFKNCEIEVVDLQQHSLFFSINTFENCTIYVSQYEEDYSNVKNKLTSSKASLFKVERKNNIVETSHIEHLAKKNSYNLNKIDRSHLVGVSLNYADLSSTKLPEWEDFFKNLSDYIVFKVKFSNVDFRKYKTNGISFIDCEFDNFCILNHDMLSGNIISCKLPIIDFEEVPENVWDDSRYIKCAFAEGTKFPKDSDFFKKCIIKDSVMPTLDYSSYNLHNYMFSECKFTDNSILPKEIIREDNLHILKGMTRMPSEYLTQFIRIVEINKPILFLNKYSSSLSDFDKFYILKKYNVNI